MLSYAAWRLPPASAFRKLPETPIDNSRIHASAAWYRLLLEAARRIPAGATVLVRGATAQGDQDTYIQHFGVALLPGRRVLPPVLNIERLAEYFVIVGSGGPIDGAEMLMATADGSIWRRRHP